MSVVRTLFLGTPEFACASLKTLINDEHYEVVGVVSQPDRKSGRKMQLTPSPVKNLAQENNLPVFTYENINTPEALEELKNLKAEAAVVVAFGQIVSQDFLDMYPNRVVNVHGSLLPEWRGAAPIQRAIMAGDKVGGVALQVMVKKLDAGDVIGSRSVEIDDNMTALELHDVLKDLGGDLLHVEFMDYIRGNLSPIQQDESKVTYAHKLEKSESEISWSKSAWENHCQIRGMLLGPGSFTFRAGKKLKIHRSEMAENSHSQLMTSGVKPGQVIAVDESSLIVACGDKPLKLLVVQPESKPKMQVADYLKGYDVRVGEVFGE